MADSTKFQPKPNKRYYCWDLLTSKGFTPLMMMAMSSQTPDILETIRNYVLKNPSELNKQNKLGWSALMLASVNCYGLSSVEIVQLLLELGADVNLTDKAGWTAFMLVCRQLHKIQYDLIAQILLKAGSDINSKSIYGKTILMLLCSDKKFSNTDIIKFLLDNGSDPNLQDHGGKTALIYACTHVNHRSNLETVQLLLDNGANPNIQDADGMTALMMILHNNNLYSENCHFILKLLLDAGSNVNLKNKNGQNAISMYVAERCRIFNTSLNHHYVKLLVDHGSDLDLLYDDGTTILMKMIESYIKSETISSVLDKVNNISTQNNRQMTSLMRYIQNYHEIEYDVVKKMLDKTIDINLKNINGDTVLTLYCGRVDISIQIIELLIDYGANINLQNNHGNTALMICCHIGSDSHADAVALLIDNGANINLRNGDGFNALTWTTNTSTNSAYIARILLENGIDINAQDIHGNTPLMIECKQFYPNYDMIKTLMMYDPDMDLKNNSGETVSDIINKNKSKGKELSAFMYGFVHASSKDKKIQLLEQEISLLRQEILFYKTTLEMHPDGNQILNLKDKFFSHKS